MVRNGDAASPEVLEIRRWLWCHGDAGGDTRL